MKKALALLVVVALTVGTVQGLSNQAKKINSMIENTSIISKNDNDCSGMETIELLYHHDKSLQSHYDGKMINVYIYHELDTLGFSHNEIEVNLTNVSFRYDI